jgi:RNA polymerase sigma-70 factor (ECF subfamily)
MSTETQLLEQARHFDPDALRALHNRFYEPVYRYVHLKVSDPQASEDLTSEVFVRVLEALRRGKMWRTTPDAWIFGIARNVVADHYRKKNRQPEVMLDERLALPDEHGPIQRVMAAERHRELTQAITCLTDEQRDVILLRFMEGLSINDVAEALNKTPGAVKGLQHRALRTLSEAMGHLSGEYVTGGQL